MHEAVIQRRRAVEARVVRDHPFAFDPTHGYSADDLLAVEPPEPPAGFDAFWRRHRRRALETPLDLRLDRVPGSVMGHDVFEVSYTSLGGRRVGGWLTRPSRAAPRCAIVTGHGYGGRDGPTLDPGDFPAVRLFPCARGLGRSAADDLPRDPHAHVLAGIEDPDRYVLLGCCADLVWTAATALLAVHPELSDRLCYDGTSFGGGIGALALPRDTRYRVAHLGTPSFGHHPLRLTLPMTGSGAAVAARLARDPAVARTLAFFDAATAARGLTTPCLVSVARFDPAVPPPGQAAIYHAIAGPKRLFWRSVAHLVDPNTCPREERALSRVKRRGLGRVWGTPGLKVEPGHALATVD